MRISDWSSDVCSSDLGIGYLEIAKDHPAIKRAVDPSRFDLQTVGEGQIGDLIGDEALSRSCVERRNSQQDQQYKAQNDPAADLQGSPSRAGPHCVLRSFRGHFGFRGVRSEEHTSELQSLMRISYAVFCLKNKNN